MPDFVLNRNHTLRTTFGHIVNFVKGVPTYVPPIIAKEALLIGAEPCDGNLGVEILEPETAPPPEPPTGAEREKQVWMAFDRICERNERESFTAQGVPTQDSVEKVAGFKITRKEQQTFWQTYRDMKGSEQ